MLHAVIVHVCDFSVPPSGVSLHSEEVGVGVSTVECIAVGGEPPDAFNLTLWRNGQLLAHTNGDHLSYSTRPHDYGNYTCRVGDLHNTSLLAERGELLSSESCVYLSHLRWSQQQSTSVSTMSRRYSPVFK